MPGNTGCRPPQTKYSPDSNLQDSCTTDGSRTRSVNQCCCRRFSRIAQFLIICVGRENNCPLVVTTALSINTQEGSAHCTRIITTLGIGVRDGLLERYQEQQRIVSRSRSYVPNVSIRCNSVLHDTCCCPNWTR